MSHRSAAFFGLLLWPWLMAWGQLSYTGGVVVQDFDSLPMTGTFDYAALGIGKGPAQLTAAPVFATGTTGWGIHARGGSQLIFLVGDGSAQTTAAYSYGILASSDRALGSLAGAHDANLGWRLVNNTGQTITRFTIGFYAEQWRNGGTSSLVGFSGEYRIVASGDIDSTATHIAVANMNAPALSAVSGSSFSMNGNSSSNRIERSATVTGISWANGQMLILRWRDLDETGSDNGLALDDVLFHASGTSTTAPLVHSTRPAAASANVTPTTPAVVVFDQPVTVTGTWVEATGSISGALPVTTSNAGPLRYTVTPVSPWPAGETISLRIIASQVTNSASQAMAADQTWAFSIVPGTDQLTPISSVQGTDGFSRLAGAQVSVQGIVTGSFQGASPALGGFFLQEEAADEDGNPATSEGLWVSDRTSTASFPVVLGDVVRVTGTVSESGSQTQLVNITALEKLGTAELPTATAMTLPVTSTISLENLEGMRVTLPQTLSVTNNSGSGGGGVNDNYSRFGELTLCIDGPLTVPTETIDPNDVPASGTTTSGSSNVAAIQAQERAAPQRCVLLDDGSSAVYPFPLPHLSAEGTRRCGDTLTGLTAVLSYSNDAYRLQPSEPLPWVQANPRPTSPPNVGGRLRVGSMNVLNYFTSFGGSNDRGASTADEFARQRAKVIAAIAGLDAHVVGLMEIQNSSASIQDLLTGLNEAVADDYAVVPDPPGGYPAAGNGADYVRCLLLYRPSRLTLRGDCQMDTNSVWFVPNATLDPLRFPLAQIFEERDSGERFGVCVNHWKSKSAGSPGPTGLNVDQNDGQAAYNDLRRQQAARLHTWLQGVATTSGEPDLLIIGDLNSYGEEDPLDTLRAVGWQDQGQRFQGTGDYSYRLGGQRGRLDHAFANATMAAQITGQDHWHINADEPSYLDYNQENKVGPALDLNTGTPYRSSDHDPVLVGIRLNIPEVDYATWQTTRTWAPGSGTGPLDDPDGDGLPNLAEFAMNLNPEAPATTPHPRITSQAGELRVQFRRHLQARGVQIIVEWSSNLIEWTELTPDATPLPFDARTELIEARLPNPNANRGFTRLRFVLSP